MSVVEQFAGVFFAMLMLAGASAFFSCSEAALFSLQRDDRRALAKGGAAGRTAIDLLANPDRLLTAILFWNLIINIVYFALASVVGIRLQKSDQQAEAAATALTSLVSLIVLSEMLPKTFGVQQSRRLATMLSLPLAAAVRVLDPFMPLFYAANKLLKRVLFPTFVPESYLEINDLERAITLSTKDQQLAAQERWALQNIISLSELQAEELMRPRRQYQSFKPPVHLDQLGGAITRSGYLLVTEPDNEEISAAIALNHMPNVPRGHLEEFAEPVIYIPWCAPVASILEQMEHRRREVAAVVNEMGETIGIVTLEDILETIFEDQSSRSARLLATSSIQPLGEGRWQVTGITSLRRLSRHFGVTLPPTKSMTVAGILQEILGRLPQQDDQVVWNGFLFRVVRAVEQDQASAEQSPLAVELQLAPPEERR